MFIGPVRDVNVSRHGPDGAKILESGVVGPLKLGPSAPLIQIQVLKYLFIIIKKIIQLKRIKILELVTRDAKAYFFALYTWSLQNYNVRIIHKDVLLFKDLHILTRKICIY